MLDSNQDTAFINIIFIVSFAFITNLGLLYTIIKRQQLENIISQGNKE